MNCFIKNLIGIAVGYVLLAALPEGIQAAELSKLAKVEQFEPTRNEMKCRGEFAVVALMTASADETVDYFGLLTVNGLPTAPFTLTLLPGDITVREKISWPIKIRGKTVNVRFRLLVVSKETKQGYQIAEVVKDYNLGRRHNSHYHGC